MVYIAHYQPRYCEENIWQLCARFDAPEYRASVVFISNRQSSVAMFGQVTASGQGAAVIWDYHVILCLRDGECWRVVDPDCQYGPSLDFNAYMQVSFHPSVPLALQPEFRLLPVSEYRRTLCTDRRHMRDSHGQWLSPPPGWPCIGEGSNLMEFASFHQPSRGELLDLAAFTKRFGT